MLAYKNGDKELTTNDITVSLDGKIYSDLVIYTGDKNLMLNNESVISLTKSVEEEEAIKTEEEIKVEMNSLLTEVLGFRALAYYHQGRCYYTIPVRHFDDTQVRLYDQSNNNFYVYNNNESLAGVNNASQLGRYGVVRNNWYSVNVNSINHIGRPAPVDPTDPINPDPNYPDPKDPLPTDPGATDDDTDSFYLNAQINILPWALRSQNADL